MSYKCNIKENTGTISSEELKERDDSKLTINSIVGKSGMEQYLDQVLQGRDGKKEVYVDNTGRTTQDLGVIQQPRAGKNISVMKEMLPHI